jgi:hypothetical protein
MKDNLILQIKGAIKTNFSKLSAYTIADNCSDLSDVEYGINEIMDYIRNNPKPIKSAYIRLYKLEQKRDKLS